MLKKDADKKYLADKVKGYLDQGDKEMADRFMKAYVNKVRSNPNEIMEMIRKGHSKAKKVKKDEKKEGSED